MDGTISINIENENGKDIICNADDVENFLSLNKKKWALFEIKNKNKNENENEKNIYIVVILIVLIRKMSGIMACFKK